MFMILQPVPDADMYEYESQFDQLCRENLIGIDEQTTEDYILKFEELCFVNGINSSVSHPEVGSVTTQEFSLKGLETNTEKLRSSASGRQNLVENDKVALRMKTLLSLKFLNETKFSCNYTNCLVDFLNSPSLVEVVQEPEDVVLYFKSRQSLLLRLSRHCGINSEAQLRKLEQRAAFKLLPNEDEYEILGKKSKRIFLYIPSIFSLRQTVTRRDISCQGGQISSERLHCES